jgi:hypothetical protein
VKFLRNLMESLLGRLKVIKDGKKNHTKYPPEELYTQRALFRMKSRKKKRIYP